MSKLNPYPLPYTAKWPPQELIRDVETVSGCSDTAAFDTGLDERDVFWGLRGCVVCGEMTSQLLERCHIIDRDDDKAWKTLRRLGWVPAGMKKSPGHEPRNGMIMCINHRHAFIKQVFFIRFQPSTQKYIFVLYDSYNSTRSLRSFHGKAVALDINQQRAPLPLLFLVHEYAAWVAEEGVVNEKDDRSFTFNHDAPTSGPPGRSSNVQTLPTTHASISGSQNVIMPPTADLVEEMLAFQRTMPSWKAWQRESMDWEGTAEENITRYVENIGVEEPAE